MLRAHGSFAKPCIEDALTPREACELLRFEDLRAILPNGSLSHSVGQFKAPWQTREAMDEGCGRGASGTAGRRRPARRHLRSGYLAEAVREKRLRSREMA